MSKLSLEHFENGVKIYQDEDLYKFTSDAIKIAKFCNIKHTDNVLDMCAGCGVVGFYIYSLCSFNKLYFNEIQNEMCELIDKNIELNNLKDKALILNKDLKDLKSLDFDKPLDVIVCNPPYFKVNGKIKKDEKVAICRHEIEVTIKEIVSKASELIKSKGKLYLIVPSDRLCEIVNYCGQNKFAVKKLEIYNHKNIATVALIEAVKDGNDGAKIKILNEIS